MILYSSPLACSCAVHLVLFELQIKHTINYVDIYSQPHVLFHDKSLYSNINPKGAVPALELENGVILTEVGVILQYLVDEHPSNLLPQFNSFARYQVMEWLSYIGSDVHKTIGSIYNPLMPQEAKEIHKQNLHRRLSYIEQALSQKLYLAGDNFTIADAYLFVMIGWEPYFKIDLSQYPNLAIYHGRILRRPSIKVMLSQLESEYHKINLPIKAKLPQRDL